MGLSLKSTSSKVLASAALLAAAAGVAGMGTYGGFTASTSASSAVNSATVNLVGGASDRLNVAATGAIPGDTMQRAVTLFNNGDQNLTGLTLTTSATTSSVLDTDATNGLQLQIDSCPVAWTEAGASPSFTYTCSSGAPTTVLSLRRVVGVYALPNTLRSLTAGSTDFLRVTMSVPVAADNTFQGKNSSIKFSFDAAFRGATSK
ncbi:TasA family protein [Arthrobacter sp. RHLT1-20]